MPKLLKVKQYFREVKGRCGPASLKMLFSHFDRHLSEDELSRLSKCHPVTGTPHANMINAARKLGFYVFEKPNSNLSEVDLIINACKLPVIANWFDEDEGHYSVVRGLDSKSIYLADPSCRSAIHKLNRDFFNDVWFDFKSTNPHLVYWRWIMVCTTEAQKFKIKGGRYYRPTRKPRR